MKKFVLITGLAISLSACSTVQEGLSILSGNSVASQSPQTMADVEKTLTIVHLAYNSIGRDLANAAGLHTLVGANAMLAKTWYDKAGDALSVADKADDAANQTGILAAVGDAEDAIQQANSIIHPKGN